MDVHVHMSYCTPCGFKFLAANYLGIKDHVLFEEIEELIKTAEVTPAEVAEQLMRSDELETVLKELIEFLVDKKKEKEEKAMAKMNEKESRVDKEEENVEKIDKEEENEEEN
jgi:chaperone BCS1